MMEVEMKFPVAEWKSLERQLASLGAKELDARREEDHYFNAPDRDFARTDEALRLRRAGLSNFLTYKGPKQDPQTKTRTEIEIPLAPNHEPADAMTQLLRHLGYRPVAVVEKQRRVLKVDRGGFVELQILAPDEQLESARKVMLAAAADLGLNNTERRSYLELLLANRQ
jgi:adenylate cyclase class 2